MRSGVSERVCARCLVDKPITEFYVYSYGTSAYCKGCAAIKSAEYRANHREGIRKYRRKWEKLHTQPVVKPCAQCSVEFQPRGRAKLCKLCRDARDAPRTIQCAVCDREVRRGGPRRYCSRLCCQRANNWKAKYGMSIKDYRKRYDEQCGKCRACEDYYPIDAKRGLRVDHDHSNGAVRGLLCDACNKAEGLMRSDATALRRLAQYIEEA